MQSTQLPFSFPCGQGLHSVQLSFRLPWRQGWQSPQLRFSFPCGQGLHNAQPCFTLPWGHGLQSPQWYFSLPCGLYSHLSRSAPRHRTSRAPRSARRTKRSSVKDHSFFGGGRDEFDKFAAENGGDGQAAGRVPTFHRHSLPVLVRHDERARGR